MADFLTTAAFAANANAPSALPLDEQIRADANLRDWFQFDAANVTYGTDPAIAAVASLKTGSARTLAQGTGSLQPTLVAGAVASPTPYAGAVFDGTDDRMLYASPPTLTGPFSFVTLFSADVTTANKQIFGAFDGAGDACFLGIGSTSLIDFRFGATGACTFGAVVAEDIYLAICSYNGADTAKARLMKVGSSFRPQPLSSATTETTISAGLYLGALNSSGAQPFDGVIGDFMAYDVDLLDSSIDSNAASLDLVLQYFRRTYGVQIT